MALSYALRSSLTGIRQRIEPAVRRAIFGTEPSWTRAANVRPWFDADDGERAAGGDELLRKWARDGYVVVDDCIAPADIDEMLAPLDQLWTTDTAIPHLELLGLRESPGGELFNLPHPAVVAMDPERRGRIRAASDWRIHGFHYVNAAARRIFWNRTLRDVASRIFRRRARPIAAINFMAGSQQALHQDMAVFHIWPQNWLMGAWIACEDVSAESGPLILHPGSHRAPFFPGFTAYPQTNLRTADDAVATAYQTYVDDVARAFPAKPFLARKGQVLFWHGMLIHGGAAITRPGATRKSMVLHYTVRGADRMREVHGPFRW